MVALGEGAPSALLGSRYSVYTSLPPPLLRNSQRVLIMFFPTPCSPHLASPPLPLSSEYPGIPGLDPPLLMLVFPPVAPRPSVAVLTPRSSPPLPSLQRVLGYGGLRLFKLLLIHPPYFSVSRVKCWNLPVGPDSSYVAFPPLVPRPSPLCSAGGVLGISLIRFIRWRIQHAADAAFRQERRRLAAAVERAETYAQWCVRASGCFTEAKESLGR